MLVGLHSWKAPVLAVAVTCCSVTAQEGLSSKRNPATGRTTLPTEDNGDVGAHSITTLSLASSSQPQEEKEAPVERAAIAPAASPFSFGLEYSVYSDYIFRGINLSEYPGEGREKPNHQLSVDVAIDLGLLVDREAGSLGELSFNTWFEWFAAQEKIDPVHGGQNLQEVDYSIAWSYDIEPIASTLTLGYVFFSLPNASAANTQEWTVALAHNDAWMWKWLWPDNEDGILNPSVFYAMDVVAAQGGSWIELGINHEFQIAENLTLTPGVIVAIDHRYLGPILGTGRGGSTRLAYVQYGLNAGYDLSAALSLPEKVGAWSLSGFLYFNDALGNVEDAGVIQDEFFGGVSIGCSF